MRKTFHQNITGFVIFQQFKEIFQHYKSIKGNICHGKGKWWLEDDMILIEQNVAELISVFKLAYINWKDACEFQVYNWSFKLPLRMSDRTQDETSILLFICSDYF